MCGEDAGSYRCLVSNDAGAVTSCPVELVIGRSQNNFLASSSIQMH